MKWILFLSLLLLTACIDAGTTSDEKLLTGTEGIVLNFPEDGLTEEIVEGERFVIPLILENKGAADVSRDAPAVLQLSLEPDVMIFSLWDITPEMRESGQSVLFPLNGKALATIAGEKTRLRALLQAKPIDPTLNKIETRVLFSACYPYLTQLEEQTCIDPKPDSLIRKSCTPETLESDEGQGAPVAITEVKQTMLPGDHPDDVRVQFLITAKNAGEGVLLHHEDYPLACLGRDGSKKPGIYVTKVAFSDFSFIEGKGGDIECNPQPMREIEDGFETRCTLNNGIPRSTPAFTTPLSIELRYGYRETISHELSILSATAERDS